MRAALQLSRDPNIFPVTMPVLVGVAAAVERESVRRYEALIGVQGETLEALAEGVAVFGSDGRLDLHNPAFARLWKLKPEQLNGGSQPHVKTVLGWCAPLYADAAFWTTVTAIGLTATPVLAYGGRQIARLIERRQGQDDDTTDVSIDEAGPGAVVIGFGRVGRTVADMLKRHGLPYIGVDADVDNVKAARKDGYSVMFGDVTRSELVDRLNLGHAKALILTMDDPVLTVRLTRRVRGWVPELPIITRARDARHAAELYAAGATEAVPETLESSLQLSEALLVDLGIGVGPVIASIHEERDKMRKAIKEAVGMDREPRLRRVRKSDVAG